MALQKINPRIEMYAFPMWVFCEGVGWNCTAKDIATELGISVQMVGTVIGHKRWKNRLRVPAREAAYHRGLDGQAGGELDDFDDLVGIG